MNNTDKLLRAFIGAQGYEISEYGTGEFSNGAYGMGVCGKGGFQQIPITDYKVTKKDADIDELVEMVEDAQSNLPNNAPCTWDGLQKVKLFLEGLL